MDATLDGMRMGWALVAALLAAACGGSDGDGETTGGETTGGGATTSNSGGSGASPTGGQGGSTTGAGGSGAGAPGEGISSEFPGDEGIASHPSVIFHADFESGFDGWDSYTNDPDRLDIVEDTALANGGSHYLRAQITRSMLENDPYLSAQARKRFDPVGEIYWRFYARFVGNTAPPHHWVRTIALNDTYSADGHAGFKPDGGDGFWFDFDVRTDDTFKFYTYWHEMRSWMCNDGSTDPGCAGYNGPSDNPHYGNNFHYANQTSFPRDAWFCLELHGKANTVGSYDGEMSFYLDGVQAARYRTGEPNGRWLRENFYSHGQYYRDEGPFEGFNFRTSDEVGWRLVVLDAYYQKNTLDSKESNGYPVQEEQTILYDDVVVATERIGCKVAPR